MVKENKYIVYFVKKGDKLDNVIKKNVTASNKATAMSKAIKEVTDYSICWAENLTNIKKE